MLEGSSLSHAAKNLPQKKLHSFEADSFKAYDLY
jgi:hypothetical protein